MCRIEDQAKPLWLGTVISADSTAALAEAARIRPEGWTLEIWRPDRKEFIGRSVPMANSL
jgi:hypothetical protein